MNGPDPTEVSAQFLSRPGDNDTLVMLTQRWDWAVPSLVDCSIDPPATAAGYRVNLRSKLAPLAYRIDLVSGVYTPLPVGFDSTLGVWYCDVGDFEQLAAILLDGADECPWDCADGNGVVDVTDLLALFSQWGVVGAPCDVDGNGVDIVDLLALMGNWGACP